MVTRWTYLVLASALIGAQLTTQADVVVKHDPTVGQMSQLAQEDAFLAMVPNPTSVNFDDEPTGTVAGDEWADLGVIFSRPGGGGLVLRPAGANVTPQSSPNALWTDFGGTIREVIEFTLTVPQREVGFWVVDSENAAAGEFIEFFDSDGDSLVSIDMPATGFGTNTTVGNFFIGVISDVPIARVLINELEADGESVGIDNLTFGVPEPSSLFVLGIGAMAALRRTR